MPGHTTTTPAHAAHTAAGGMKRKLGPLPMWAWVLVLGGTIGAVILIRKHQASSSTSSSSTGASGNTVDPNNPLGLTYAQEATDEAEGIDPNTGNTWAAEQASNDTNNSGDSGGGDDSTGSGTGTITSSAPTTDTTPGQTLAGETGDITSAITALQAFYGAMGIPLPGTATPGGASTPSSTAPAGASSTPATSGVAPTTAAAPVNTISGPKPATTPPPTIDTKVIQTALKKELTPPKVPKPISMSSHGKKK